MTLAASGQKVDLKTNAASAALEFAIKDPVYNLQMTIEPGIVARLFIDIGLWGKNWDIPVDFPSLAFTLPAGGVTFGCHDGTVCARDFSLKPDTKELAKMEVARWANQFETNGFSQCRDAQCEQGIRFVRVAYEANLGGGDLAVDPLCFVLSYCRCSTVDQ